jgi:hypothetical protein
MLALFVSSQRVGEVFPVGEDGGDLRQKSESCDVGRAQARTASILGRCRHFRGAAGMDIIKRIETLEHSSLHEP